MKISEDLGNGVVIHRDGDAGDDWRSDKPGAKFTRYRVELHGVEIGFVSQTREHTYKKAGRLRYGDAYPLAWEWRYTGRRERAYHRRFPVRSRKQAVEDLLHWYHEGPAPGAGSRW